MFLLEIIQLNNRAEHAVHSIWWLFVMHVIIALELVLAGTCCIWRFKIAEYWAVAPGCILLLFLLLIYTIYCCCYMLSVVRYCHYVSHELFRMDMGDRVKLYLLNYYMLHAISKISFNYMQWITFGSIYYRGLGPCSPHKS